MTQQQSREGRNIPEVKDVNKPTAQQDGHSPKAPAPLAHSGSGEDGLKRPLPELPPAGSSWAGQHDMAALHLGVCTVSAPTAPQASHSQMLGKVTGLASLPGH